VKPSLAGLLASEVFICAFACALARVSAVLASFRQFRESWCASLRGVAVSQCVCLPSGTSPGERLLAKRVFLSATRSRLKNWHPVRQMVRP
jgi:hypothetical protein